MGIPIYEEGANTPSRTRLETPAFPTRASTTVTGTLHTHFSIDPTLSRTLPDSANLPPRHQFPDNIRKSEHYDKNLIIKTRLISPRIHAQLPFHRKRPPPAEVSHDDSSIGIDQSAVPTVYASGVSPDTIPWSTAEDIIRDIVREGPFDVDTTPMETEDSPLINTSMPGCPYRMTSYTGTAMVDADTRYGLQLHHPRFLEFIGAPESARLLNQSPSFWVDRLGQESAMAAAVNLQRDAGFMMSNLQIMGQFVTSLHRLSAEMLSIGVDHVVFPVEEVDRLSVMPRAQRAAKYMTAMGLWRPPSGPGAPGPLPTSTCTSCMNCEYCFGRKGQSTQ